MDRPVTKNMSPAEWVAAALSEARASGAQASSIPLDFLLGESYTNPWDIDVARAAYRAAVDSCPREDLVSHMVALVVPLEEAAAVPGVVPSLAEPDLNEFEPPSLYVIDRRHFQVFNDFEEYRVPIEEPNLSEPVGKPVRLLLVGLDRRWAVCVVRRPSVGRRVPRRLGGSVVWS